MGMFSPQIGVKPLEGLCRRVGTSLEAGVDARTVWKREAERATGPLQSRLFEISDNISRGSSLAEAFRPTGDYFPSLLHEMVKVGEQTGHLDTIFNQLADHYQTHIKMRRMFLIAIAWPMMELILAIFVIGFGIWITGMIGQGTDVLGLGLVGNKGLSVYVTLVLTAALVVAIIVRAINRGLVWTKPIQRFVFGLPGLGKQLQTLALARLAWSLHLTMNTGMDVRRSLALSLQSTQNARYTDQISAIDAEIMAGNSIHEAFRNVGGYPVEFLDTLAVGEQSGKLVESMGRLATQYQERARIAMAAVAVIAGVAVVVVVAAIIITLIFRIAYTSYIGPLYDATKMKI
jgi:type II secretory pathway component PulF